MNPIRKALEFKDFLQGCTINELLALIEEAHVYNDSETREDVQQEVKRRYGKKVVKEAKE